MFPIMKKTIQNPLKDRSVMRAIHEKVYELTTQRAEFEYSNICDHIYSVVFEAAKWGFTEGWNMCKQTKDGTK